MKYVCELCGFVYDEEAGEPARGIPAGTVFSALSPQYSCPLCGSEKEAFTKLEKRTKLQPAAENDRRFWNAVKYSVDREESDR